MTVAEVLRILVGRTESDVAYNDRTGDAVPTGEEFATWSVSAGLDDTGLLDQLGLALARGYAAGALTFTVCDFIVNDLNAFAENLAIARGDVFLEVYSAFDAGEYFRNDDRREDPEMTYTQPAIAALVHRLGSH